jgi:hypothetical protein
MKTRRANKQDVIPLVKFAKRMHPTTTFAHVPFNPPLFRSNLRKVLEHPNADVLIATRTDGEICGLLIAWAEPLLWSHQMFATDVHFVAEAGGDQLLREFTRWARKKNCVEAGVGTFNGADEDRIEKLYNRIGFETVGRTFRMELTA